MVGGILMLIPQIASANAGTPLMWASMLHLVFGNAFIGIGEGLLLALVFKRPKWRCIGLMIAANYFSAWLGGLFLAERIASVFDWNLYNAWRLFWAFVVGTYLVTILLEFPFVALCFCRQDRRFARGLKASLLIQTISYICLFGWYWGASGKSLYTKMHIVPPSEIRLPENFQLYYISGQGGRVYQNSQILGDVISTNWNDRLIIRPIKGNTNQWELGLRFDAWNDDDAIVLAVLSPIDGHAMSIEPTDEHRPNGRDTPFNFGTVLMLGQDNTNWNVHTGFWPIEGLHAENEKTGECIYFAWETPFSQWYVRSAILLPDDKVIFQLGQDQICVLDLTTKKVALLTRGRGPAVILK